MKEKLDKKDLEILDALKLNSRLLHAEDSEEDWHTNHDSP